MEAVQPSLALNGGAVISLGGCGENGRNCFLFTSDRGNLLLDCGVKRELGNPSEIYPALTPRIAARIIAPPFPCCMPWDIPAAYMLLRKPFMPPPP